MIPILPENDYIPVLPECDDAFIPTLPEEIPVLPEEPIPILPEPPSKAFRAGAYSYIVALNEYDQLIDEDDAGFDRNRAKSFDAAASRAMAEIGSIVHDRMSRMLAASLERNPHISRSTIVAAIRERLMETIEQTLNRLY